MINKALFNELPFEIDERITVLAIRHHAKAGEAYLDVEFRWKDQPSWRGSVPVNYRSTGLDAQTLDDCRVILRSCLSAWDATARKLWEKDARSHWHDRKAITTRLFFDTLFKKIGSWVCQGHELPSNPNWARRTQDIKGAGFTLSTNTKMYCEVCKGTKTHIMLLPIPLGLGFRYETISRTLTQRIVRTLSSIDAFEGTVRPAAGLLPDHKFPEVRWESETSVDNPENMSESEIKQKFQLLNNQRNLQKRETCRRCYQTGRRGFPYAIQFFASGDIHWPDGVPEKGSAAEAGCKGCAWYDFDAWREKLRAKLLINEAEAIL